MNLLTTAYAPVYRNMVFPLYEGVLRRRRIYQQYRELLRTPYLSLDEIRETQRRRLNEILVHCERTVPFYRDLFAKHGVEAASVRDVETLRKLGISTDKAAVKAAGDAILSTAFVKESLNNSATSGSSGNPVLYFMSFENWAYRMAVKYRSEDWLGKPVGTPCTMIWGHEPGITRAKWMKLKLYWALQNYQFFSAFDVGDERLAEIARSMRRWGSRFLESYVTVAHRMAKAVEKSGMEPPPLRGVMVGAERLHAFQKEEIERILGCAVYNRYGCTEFSNVASECTERRGLHINMDHVWVEVVDEKGEPVVGKVGDLVITDLRNYAMPLIRYRIGDRAVMTDERCTCGRSFPMLREVVGRVSETIKLGGGREVHDMYFIWRLSRTPGIERFQVVQDSYDHVRFRIEHDGTVPRERTEEFMRERLVELAGFGISFDVEFVESIPATRAGKMLFFVSEMENAAAPREAGSAERRPREASERKGQ